MTTVADQKSPVLARAAGLVGESGDGWPGPGSPPSGLDALLTTYFRHLPPEDLVRRDPEELLASFASHLEWARSRTVGSALVRAVDPPAPDGGGRPGRTVIQVVTDDMPFLVDSVSMELSRRDHDTHALLHPQYLVERDAAGTLQSLVPGGTGAEPAAAADTPRDAGTVPESWIHVEIDRVTGEECEELVAALRSVLHDVRTAVEDWPAMRQRIEEVVGWLREHGPDLPDTEVTQAADLMQWLADDHFTFLGYRQYTLRQQGDEAALDVVPGTGLGILREEEGRQSSASFDRLPPAAKERARERSVLVLAKANSRSTVHRAAYLDYVGIKTFGADGEVNGEHRFLGLFSSAAYTESVTRVPVLRDKAHGVLEQLGFSESSHTGKALLDTLENYPRDELFQIQVDELAPIAEAVMHARERRQLRAFTRRDTYGRYLSVLVYLPRERYNTAVREQFSTILTRQLGADSLEFSVRINESSVARVHFVVRPPAGETLPEVDTVDLERRFGAASRSWRDDLLGAASEVYDDATASRLARTYGAALPEAYKEDFDATQAVRDIARLEAITGDEGQDLALRAAPEHGRARLKIFRVGEPLSLSQVLPVLASMGVEVLDERPYELSGLGRRCHIYDFGLGYRTDLPEDADRLFTDALRAIWDGRNEVDGFNALVLTAGLTWQQVSVLRAYAKYMKQGLAPFALDYVEEALVAHAGLARLVVRLFETRFDPHFDGGPDERAQAEQELGEQIREGLDEVVSLDHDRILRSYLAHVQHTVRTNYYRTAADGTPRDFLSLKLDPRELPDLPDPRPAHEIFVCSPRVEGVHLRFGAVARGGLRWSDRRDDFRTEVLGLVKAQMVKNTVIVPVGAKGGFFAKQLPDPATDREGWQAEGVAAYRTFVSGMLDVTDDLVDQRTVPPPDVVRHDGDDSYLVVAADKGTATFSDIANEIAGKYGFWLGDAFASGGSEGYDHKGMGITARGAWVSVQRHFREMGIDCQREDITAVGVGDMSGDVFGNGMLCSEHIRLLAAFDHRDIFLDPDPDPVASYAERQRVFDLGRSSWRDYDTSVISDGGGIYSRQAKSVPVTAPVRRALGLDADVTELTPAALIRAILQAPADLLWNGGIGTYVKASTETHADVGDKGNDAIRVDGADLRVRCIGEGGNLGLTQRGRIEYARAGGRVNSDFIDNSGGVDTSDREVNIKILLDRLVADGTMDRPERNALLASMTDEVAEQVLANNYEQNLALANAETNAPSLLHVHEDLMRRLENDGVLDRELEDLPSSKEVKRRLEAGESLTTPELAVLMSWVKIRLQELLIDTDLPDDPLLRSELIGYFPPTMRQQFRRQMAEHPLHREIIITRVVTDLVNNAGLTYWIRLTQETGASAADLTRVHFVAREIFGAEALHEELAGYDHHLSAQLIARMRLQVRTLVERASRRLLGVRGPLDTEELVDFFSIPVQRTMAALPEIMSGTELAAYERRRDELTADGVPADLASRVAVLPSAVALLGVVRNASRLQVDPLTVARVHFALAERLGLPLLAVRVVGLPREDRWQTMARAHLRDDLENAHAELTAQVLSRTDPQQDAAARVAAWEEADPEPVASAVTTLATIGAEDVGDLPRVSVGVRAVRELLR